MTSAGLFIYCGTGVGWPKFLMQIERTWVLKWVDLELRLLPDLKGFSCNDYGQYALGFLSCLYLLWICCHFICLILSWLIFWILCIFFSLLQPREFSARHYVWWKYEGEHTLFLVLWYWHKVSWLARDNELCVISLIHCLAMPSRCCFSYPDIFFPFINLI